MTHYAQESLTVNKNSLMLVKVMDITLTHVVQKTPEKDNQRGRKERIGYQVTHICVEDTETQEAQSALTRQLSLAITLPVILT